MKLSLNPIVWNGGARAAASHQTQKRETTMNDQYQPQHSESANTGNRPTILDDT